jgi:4-hydroxythreonine-4-phosphate dehydrogenase
LKDRLFFHPIQLREENTFGILNPRNAPYVLDTLDHAIQGCLSSSYDGMVTAPIQKSTISELGIPFSGHTEYLADKSKTSKVVMMLCGETQFQKQTNGLLRVALVTTHLPLNQVVSAIQFDTVLQTIQIVHKDLKNKFGIAQPKIFVAGLNPHAGESGYLGTEEITIITPAIERARHKVWT